MNYANIKNCDIANGPGVRVSLFVSGCRHHCKGCFNAETWDFKFGQPYTKATEAEILELLKPDYIQGYLYDVDLIPDGKVFTDATEEMLSYIDILVDGEFVQAEKDLSLQFRGSRNQRILKIGDHADFEPQ